MCMYVHTGTQTAMAWIWRYPVSQRENGMERVKEREPIITLMANARLEPWPAVGSLVMLSGNCLQVKCLGVKKAALLPLKSAKTSGRKYLAVSALCGSREFLWRPLSLPSLFNLSNPIFSVLGL